MLAKKKKLSKKEIKEDKLVTTFYNSKNYYEENQNKIFVVVGVIAAIIVAIILYNNKVESNNLTASAELSRVLPTYTNGQYQEAIDGKPGTKEIGLLKIVEEYGGSEQGELARIYLANSYYFTEQYDKALEEYENYSGSDKIMNAAALAGAASVYVAKSNYTSAAETYAKAANVSKYNPATSEYLLKAGINYIKANDPENAKTVLERVKKDYSPSLAARDVDRYLSQINS